MLGFLILGRVIFRGCRSFIADERSRAVLLLAASLIGGGTLFYHRFEDMTWLDSVYFSVITLTTVGYGDHSPQTALGKVFTMIYLLVGIGVLVTLAAEITRHVIGADRDDG